MSCDKEKNGGHGFGLAVIAATAAAGYFLYTSKNSAQNRKKFKGWMVKAKGEVLEHIEKLKKIDEEDYNRVIDKVSDKYSKLKNLDKEEVRAVMDDLRGHWKKIKKDIEPKVKKAAKKGKVVTRKVVHSAAKKVVKKTAPPNPNKKALRQTKKTGG